MQYSCSHIKTILCRQFLRVSKKYSRHLEIKRKDCKEGYQIFNSTNLEVYSLENIFFKFPLDIIYDVAILPTRKEYFREKKIQKTSHIFAIYL